MEAGDADTNCAPAGALLACRLGLSSIPESWLEMVRLIFMQSRNMHFYK